MPPLIDRATPLGLLVDLPGWIRWILSRVHLSTTNEPLGPVVLDLRAKRYLNIEVRVGRGYIVSIDLRD